MNSKFIRNFSIIAHIDHGKSTLADRMLEITETVEKRKMREQVLDRMDLEREKGITIKMKPVRMDYKFKGEDYELNLIDTPGHIDFSYEVSRALKAVEGSILLVDATQGVQAQTFSVLGMAQELGKVIIPVITKIDSPVARIEETEEEIIGLLNCKREDIRRVSGKTGEGVRELLDYIILNVPSPSVHDEQELRSLIFDIDYSNHTGVKVFIRVMEGSVKKNDQVHFMATDVHFNVQEVGAFTPYPIPLERLVAGEIGYIITGIKEPGIASVGDTVTLKKSSHEALPGYMKPKPVIWASVYPESQDDFDNLRDALNRLRLSDSALWFEEENSGILGRGYRCGFLGMLHLEIVVERLKREFNIKLVIASPSITYEIETRDGKKTMVYTPEQFPEEFEIVGIREPWANLRILTPDDYLSNVLKLLHEHSAILGDTDIISNTRYAIHAEMPLRELMRNFFDKLKSVSSGYASLSYEMSGLKDADVVKLEILVAEEKVPAFSRIVSRDQVQREGELDVERLYRILPKQMFTTKIQARAYGRILASRSISAMKKDVTAHMYGGDITRKMKLREKQKKGKKRMGERGVVRIPEDVFLKMMKRDDEN